MWHSADYIFDGKEFLSGKFLELNDEGIVIQLSDAQPDAPIIHHQGILSPGFINSHLHLELSGLKGLIDEKTTLPGFIKKLQEIRPGTYNAEWESIREAESSMYQSGTVAACDIANSLSTLEIKRESKIRWHTFIELFAFASEKAEIAYEKGRSIYDNFSEDDRNTASITPHAPYSVSLDLLTKIFSESADDAVFTIHNQEHREEDDFMREQRGSLAKMLSTFGIDPAGATLKGASAPRLLMPLLKSSQRLLLVHNTFTSEEDVATTASDRVAWCFCPRANRYIEDSLPDLPMFHRSGVSVVFGTDSLASNHSLELLEELNLAADEWPSLPTEFLLRGITSEPAKFLGFDELGFFQPGSRPSLVNIALQSRLPVLCKGCVASMVK